MLERWGGFVARRALAVLLAGMALTVAAAIYGFGVFDSLSTGGFDDPDSEASIERESEEDAFGNRSVDIDAIYSDDELTADSPEFQAAVEAVVAQLPDDAVSSVVPYYDAPPEQGLVSEDGHSAQVLISLEGDDQDAVMDNFDKVEPGLHAEGLQTDLAGPLAVYNDVNEITSEDLERAELLSMPIVILLALLIFGSVVAASMPAMVGLLSMIGALALVRVITQFTEVSVFSVNVISLLGIGLAIDYALFVISRFREEMAALPDRRSGGGRHRDPTDHGHRRPHRPVLRAHRCRCPVQPADLPAGVPAQHGLRRRRRGRDRDAGRAHRAARPCSGCSAARSTAAGCRGAGTARWCVEDVHGWWARLARGVMRRPIVVIVAVVIVLLAIASPFLGVKWGSVDHRVLPEDAPAHIAADKLATDFGTEHVLGEPAAARHLPGRRRGVPGRGRGGRRDRLGPAGRGRGRLHAAAGRLERQQPDRALAGHRPRPA